jgi:hypothetical protein
MSEDEDDGPLQLVSGKYADEGGFMDSAAAMVLKCMSEGAAAGQLAICSEHIQRLWAGVRQLVIGNIVPIRQLRATAGDSRSNTRLRLASPPVIHPFRNSTTRVIFPAR